MSVKQFVAERVGVYMTCVLGLPHADPLHTPPPLHDPSLVGRGRRSYGKYRWRAKSDEAKTKGRGREAEKQEEDRRGCSSPSALTE